jgi:fibronectin type 3 domain-containing protein
MKTLMRKFGLAAVLLWAGFNIWHCGKKPANPVFPKESQFPPPPYNLAVTVDDQNAILTWNIGNPSAVQFYRIYRRDTTMAVFAAIDTSIDRIYIDRNLKGDRIYFYQVSAVNAGGFESTHSAIVSAVPNTFASIIIAAGADYISQRQVTLKVTAPSRTALMKLSNDSLFTNASWQRFEGTTSWILSFGDGTKTVFAKFRDSDGNEFPQLVKDSIILDTIALITEVRENSNGQIKRAGDIVHFRLAAKETGGRATINIFSGPQNILLFDDGTQGDKTPADSVYEVDYRVPQGLQVIQAKVRGNFVDRVGNVAETVLAATQITIQKDPDPVTMFQPTSASSQQSALRLTWTASKDTFDFANYSIYRSLTPNFTPLPANLIDRVTLRETTFYTDLNLLAGTTYYYRIVVFDLAGFNSASSNEVSARTTANLPPSPVILNTPILAGDGSSQVQLSWSRSTDNDFASYRLYRANSAAVNSNSLLVTAITNQSQTIYLDENLKAATKYFYRIYVYDQAANAAGSNIDSVITAPNQPPTPVMLALPAPVDTAALSLSWSQNNDADFASYRIFRAKDGDPPIDPDKQQQPIAILNNNRANTTYLDRGLARGKKYTYQIFVYDLGGKHCTGSNLVQGTTR